MDPLNSQTWSLHEIFYITHFNAAKEVEVSGPHNVFAFASPVLSHCTPANILAGTPYPAHCANCAVTPWLPILQPLCLSSSGETTQASPFVATP
ncbi:MAG: hypothetical protein H7210_12755 [Pyrinomonadaceae bacterium]|nr:hypothetical protein [Phycisphaerales bacterium]